MLDSISHRSYDLLGGIPPSLNATDIVSCKRELLQHWNLRCNLRRRFGSKPGIDLVRLRGGVLSKRPECLELENGLAVLHASDPKSLADFAATVIDSAMKRPHEVMELTSSLQFVELLLERYCEETEHATQILLITIICALFKTAAGKKLHHVVDCGLTMPMMDMLESDDWILVDACVKLMNCVADHCGYARDALICMGLHERLFEIIGDRRTPDEVKVASCHTLLAIFRNPDPLDNSVILEAVPKLMDLMKCASVAVVGVILQIFVEMSNKMRSLIMTFDELGMYPVVVSMLDDSDLAGGALALLGNMCVCQPKQVKELLDLNVLPKLMYLFHVSEFTADVLWVISNLLEVKPSVVLPLLPPELIQLVLSAAETERFGIEVEAAFFLSTVIVFVPVEHVGLFMTREVVDLLVDMLACEVNPVVLRTMDAIRTFIHAAELSSNGELLAILMESDVVGRLEELSESNALLIAEGAAGLKAALSRL